MTLRDRDCTPMVGLPPLVDCVHDTVHAVQMPHADKTQSTGGGVGWGVGDAVGMWVGAAGHDIANERNKTWVRKTVRIQQKYHVCLPGVADGAGVGAGADSTYTHLHGLSCVHCAVVSIGL